MTLLLALKRGAVTASSMEMQGAETGDAGHAGVHHPLHQRASDGRIHRVAAALQDQGAGFHCLGLRRDDHSVGYVLLRGLRFSDL